jgi:hypothetical protein
MTGWDVHGKVVHSAVVTLNFSKLSIPPILFFRLD